MGNMDKSDKKQWKKNNNIEEWTEDLNKQDDQHDNNKQNKY